MTARIAWLMLSSAEPYGHRVLVRSDLVAAVVEAGVMHYNDQRQPEGVKGSRHVYTMAGNLLNVQESADEIMAALREAALTQSPDGGRGE